MKILKNILMFLLLFVAVKAFSYTVVLAWDPNSETDLAGYNLYWGTSSRQYNQVMTMGLVTTNSVTNLVVGITYYFAVTAFNTSGLESDFSNEVSYKADTNFFKVPQAPLYFKIED